MFLYSLAQAEQSPTEYRSSHLARIAEDYVNVAKHITISEFRLKDMKWKDILPLIERRARQGDTAGRGLRIYVPAKFQKRWDQIAEVEWTISLADNLNVLQIFVESPPPGWYYYPVTPREIAVIPYSELKQDVEGQ